MWKEIMENAHLGMCTQIRLNRPWARSAKMKACVWQLYLLMCVCVYIHIYETPTRTGSSSGAAASQRKSQIWRHAEDEAMSEVLTVDAILFGLLVFSGILGNMLVIHVVRWYRIFFFVNLLICDTKWFLGWYCWYQHSVQKLNVLRK